jgi:hypothetical protein
MLANCRQRKYSTGCAHAHPLPVRLLQQLTTIWLTGQRFIRNSCAQKLGFSNAELLQDTDWDKVALNPRRAAPKLPKWVWCHDPEAYAYENFWKAAESEKKGIPMEDETSFEPNYPRGYHYVPWSIDQIMDDMRNHREVDLGPGDWE